MHEVIKTTIAINKQTNKSLKQLRPERISDRVLHENMKEMFIKVCSFWERGEERRVKEKVRWGEAGKRYSFPLHPFGDIDFI